jgi:cyclophilin family peptidyl-prolyl cis-trans isomerase
MKRLLALLSTLLVSGAFAQEPNVPPPASDAPKVRFDTSMGSFVVQLDARRAPLTVANFLRYVQEGHYDGTLFSRVVENFVAQAGGYTVDYKDKPTHDPIVNESGNGLANLRGTIAMARTGEPHSATAQFFINLVDNESLNPLPTRWGYTVFGTVVEGMDVIDSIGHAPTGAVGPFQENAPLKPIVIEKAQVL